MSHSLTISDEAYSALTTLAREQGETPEALVESWVTQHAAEAAPLEAADRDPQADPRYQTFEEFLSELGMSQEDIRAAQATAESDDADL